MKHARDFFVMLFISATVLVAGFWLIEKHYKAELDKMGWLSKSKTNNTPFGRRISGYTIAENVPNFEYTVYDDNFKRGTEATDSNGFKTGGYTVAKIKDSNTIRIFVTGGSAAWGSIESREIMKDTTYPSGTYCYASSIAGKLKIILNKRYPQFKFEVIDAAVVKFHFNQSMALYFEKLHDFSPDVIINFDGFNDIGNLLDFIHPDAYQTGAEELEEEIEVTTMARMPRWPYTLAFYNYKYARAHANLPGGGKATTGRRAPHKGTVINHQPDVKAWQTIRPHLCLSQKMLWLIDSYERQLRADKVYSVFCLQPTLRRRVNQKELSATEQKFRDFLEKITTDDTAKLTMAFSQNKITAAFNDTISRLIGMDSYWFGNMIGANLLNDCSPVFDSIVENADGAYVDVGKAMATLASDKEFYVDYCHLTPFGNQFVAELLADKLAGFISRRAQSGLLR